MCQIKKIYQTELEYLKDGIKNSGNPYHTFTLSSINGVHPESRTIVLRGLDLNPLRIYFNADYRSPKVQQIISNPFCSALFYNPKRRIQLRFKCKAVVNNQNEISSAIWKNTALQSRKCYMGPHSPSKVLDEWHPNIPLEYLKTDPDKNHSNQGYVNFTYIELEIIESDLLQLHHDGHIRFKVENGNKLFFVSP